MTDERQAALAEREALRHAIVQADIYLVNGQPAKAHDTLAAVLLSPAGRYRAIEAEAATLDVERPLTFREFAAVNRARCESPEGFHHLLSAWSTSDWFLAAMGELGEAANKAKKLNRVRDGIPGNTETPDQLLDGLADEIADTVIYLDLLAQSLGWDLGHIVAWKFNKTSRKIGAPHRLAREYRDGGTR